jgi:hypothetical protein
MRGVVSNFENGSARVRETAAASVFLGNSLNDEARKIRSESFPGIVH